MRETEDWRQLSTLPVELKIHLGFKEDPTQSEWLIHDHLTQVGGVKLYEWLPTRVRVSREGTRYEVGVVKEDVEGLLALARIINPQAQDYGMVKNFWGNHPKFSAKEEGDWLYIGANVKPTPLDFETEFDPLQQAYDLALKAAVKNLTYDQMKSDEEESSWLKFAEGPEQRTLLFSSLEEEMFRGYEPTKTIDPEKIITANNLREFPLATYKTSIHEAPGILVRNGVSKEVKNISLIAHNGHPMVDIRSGESTYNRNIGKWEHDDFRLKLIIPEGIDIRMVSDLVKLNRAQIIDDNFKVATEKNIIVRVEDNSLKVTAPDKSFDLEMRTPCCEDCKTPTWNFPWPEEDDMDPEESRKKFRMHTAGISAGIYKCQIYQDGEQKVYCVNCVGKIEDQYAKEHPFVIRPRAIAVARRRLDEMGYPEVEIWEDQVWRTDWLGNKGWEFFTKIEYERSGREIIRYTGTPTLTDDGEFNPDMFPREYVKFRYTSC